MSLAPVLPVSLSPHICVVPSPDLEELLSSFSLPPIQHLLQSFSPLPQVTTRTTTLTSVSHPFFHLRFSNIQDLEAACHEDEDSRAGRTIDWIGQRITKRAAAWVEHVERDSHAETKNAKTPWWQDLQRCIEGDRTPSRSEGWNHPVAVILAVSTHAPNPLQAVTQLHSRLIDLPSWVDPVRMRYTLIIHPSNSPLNTDEAAALFNATTKQYGLHTHLLLLSLAKPATPLTFASLLPELPSTPMESTVPGASSEGKNRLNLTESDVAQIARFVREFVTMSLVPWMERCVLDWNEAYSSTRRLPSRLFSSTRRLFGGASGPNNASVSSSHHPNPHSDIASSPTSTSFSGPPLQQRRLAEFATFLGDLKLAVPVWDALRKEGHGGSEVLPLLLASTPSVGAHATYSLSTLQAADPSPSSQLRAITYAVRWASNVRDLETLGGERWLDMAAGVAEEPPLALLLAHAALLSARKGATRRAAMWYVFAAHRLEKCGIRPLTLHFLRKAHDLYLTKPPKNLSPSFDDAAPRKHVDGFDAIMPSIEYSLGRLMYRSGDTESALRYFLGLLKGSPHFGDQDVNLFETDALYVGDFKVAFEHLKSTVGQDAFPVDLKPPFSFCSPVDTHIRLASQGELDVNNVRWHAFEETWLKFWKPRGPERLEKGGKVIVGERLWVDIMLKNPLDVEINLANLTVKVEFSNTAANVEVEVIDNVFLRPKEWRIVPISIIAHNPSSLKVTHVTYSFLSLLPVLESLAVRGPRLHQTQAQRQSIVYGPDVVLTAEVEEGTRQLDLSLTKADGSPPSLFLGTGECTELTLSVRNTGKGIIDDIWIIHSSSVWLDLDGAAQQSPKTLTQMEVVRSDNTLATTPPVAIPLGQLHGTPALAANDSLDLRLVFHAEQSGVQEVAVLLVFREGRQPSFYSSRLHHVFDVVPILDVGISVRPSADTQPLYTVNIEVENVNEESNVRIAQVTTASANWSCSILDSQSLASLSNLPPLQAGRVFFQAAHWNKGSGSTQTKEFVVRQLGAVLEGRQIEPLEPPALDVLYCQATEVDGTISTCRPCNMRLIESSRRNFTRGQLLDQFQHLPARLLPHIFPLRNPQALDIIVTWEIPSDRRYGYVTIPDTLLGACHASLDEVIQRSETAKVNRTIYAETTREREQLLKAAGASGWNAEMDPIVVRAVASEPRIEHDFSQGDCVVPVTFMMRNFSLTNHTRFVLRLQSVSPPRPSETHLSPPSYIGSLTRRGALAPLSSMEIKTKMWLMRPGIYSLGGWRLETEVGGDVAEPWHTRGSFSQYAPPGDEGFVTVIQCPS